jgi:hypothetical protein
LSSRHNYTHLNAPSGQLYTYYLRSIKSNHTIPNPYYPQSSQIFPNLPPRWITHFQKHLRPLLSLLALAALLLTVPPRLPRGLRMGQIESIPRNNSRPHVRCTVQDRVATLLSSILNPRCHENDERISSHNQRIVRCDDGDEKIQRSFEFSLLTVVTLEKDDRVILLHGRKIRAVSEWGQREDRRLSIFEEDWIGERIVCRRQSDGIRQVRSSNAWLAPISKPGPKFKPWITYRSNLAKVCEIEPITCLKHPANDLPETGCGPIRPKRRNVREPPRDGKCPVWKIAKNVVVRGSIGARDYNRQTPESVGHIRLIGPD